MIKEKVLEIMEKIRPSLQSHGGDAELVDVVDGVVSLHRGVGGIYQAISEIFRRLKVWVAKAEVIYIACAMLCPEARSLFKHFAYP
jgi:hypothetical protein